MNIAKLKFDFAVRRILQTQPIVQTEDRITIISMLCHSELKMYLLAVKSFCFHLGSVPKIVILDDASLTLKDRAILKTHIPSVRLIHLVDVPREDVPVGGTWERLLLISDLVKDSYVIQLDADTLTLSSLPEVAGYVKANMSFTLMSGTNKESRVVSIEHTHIEARKRPGYLVQSACEKNMAYLPIEDKIENSISGNSGFAGFAKGSITRVDVVRVSKAFHKLVGDQWLEWGSEQVASNTLIANTAQATGLHSAKYKLFWGTDTGAMSEVILWHFISRHRYENGVYKILAQSIIEKLSYDETDNIPAGAKLQLAGSRMRGEASRLKTEGARLRASGIVELEEAGNIQIALGERLWKQADAKFAKGTSLMSGEK